MSIVSRASSDYGEKGFPKGFVLIKTEVAEKAISLIINDEDEAAAELARLLLVLEHGIEAETPSEGPGRCPATRNTIDMMVELAYLDSRPYRCSLMEWRDRLSAQALPVTAPEAPPEARTEARPVSRHPAAAAGRRSPKRIEATAGKTRTSAANELAQYQIYFNSGTAGIGRSPCV